MGERQDPNKIAYHRWLYWKELVDLCRLLGRGWNQLSKDIGRKSQGYVAKGYEFRNVAHEADIPHLEDLVGRLMVADQRILERVASLQAASNPSDLQFGIVIGKALGAGKALSRHMRTLEHDQQRFVVSAMTLIVKQATQNQETGNVQTVEVERTRAGSRGRLCNETEMAEFRSLVEALQVCFGYGALKAAEASGYLGASSNMQRAINEGRASVAKLEALRMHYRNTLKIDPETALEMLGAARPAPPPAVEVIEGRVGRTEQVRITEQDGHTLTVHRVAVEARREELERRPGERGAAWLARLTLAEGMAGRPAAAYFRAAVDATLDEIAVYGTQPAPPPPPANPMDAARAALWSATEHLTEARATPPDLGGLPPYARDAVRSAHETAVDETIERIATILTTLE